MGNDSKDLRHASSEQLAGLLKELLGPHNNPEADNEEESNPAPQLPPQEGPRVPQWVGDENFVSDIRDSSNPSDEMEINLDLRGQGANFKGRSRSLPSHIANLTINTKRDDLPQPVVEAIAANSLINNQGAIR